MTNIQVYQIIWINYEEFIDILFISHISIKL